MKTIFLNLPDEQTANNLLYRIIPAVMDEAGNEITPAAVEALYPNVDVIGTMYNSDAVIGADGTVITPATAQPGYHVNIADDACPAALAPYEVFPATPSRVFGGIE